VAVECTERANDRTLVAKCIEVRVAYCVCQTALTEVVLGLVQAAVIRYRCLAVQPQAWVELLAGNCVVGRRYAYRLDLVLYLYLNLALVEYW